MRLVAVLGYSPRRPAGLHSICEERVRHAERVVRDDDAVLLTGEADLMHGAWNGHEVLLDPHARNTRDNARAIAAAADRTEADEVVLVTSAWHAPRARSLVRATLRGAIPVKSASPRGRPPLVLLLREVGCLLLLPLHLAALRLSALRRRPSRSP